MYILSQHSHVLTATEGNKRCSMPNTFTCHPAREEKTLKKSEARILFDLPGIPSPTLALAYKQNHNFHIRRKSTARGLTFLQPRNIIFVLFKMLSCSYFYVFQLSLWHLRGNTICDIKKMFKNPNLWHWSLYLETNAILWESVFPIVLQFTA